MLKYVLLFLILPGVVLATPCSVAPFYDGWSGTFSKYTIYNGFIYGLDEKFMYVTLVNGDTYGFVDVPQAVPQSITNTTNGDTFYNTRISGHYHQTLMTELCGNILNQDGRYLLAR